MSENDAGVDATRFLCSSGEMNLGSASMSTIAMFCVSCPMFYGARQWTEE